MVWGLVGSFRQYVRSYCMHASSLMHGRFFLTGLAARGSDSFTVRGQEMAALLCSVKV